MIFSTEQLERYSRHFALHDIGAAGQKKLLQSSVMVIGAGALGSGALMYLAAAGVGTIGIADYDQVELSNLQRQVIHNTDSLGINKALSAERTIGRLNPDVTVQTYPERISPDNIQAVIEPYDFVIDGTDRFESKFLINDACVLSKKPYSHAGAVRFEGQTMTYVPGQGPCLRCILENIPPHEDAASCSQAGVLGAVPGILGGIQAMEAIKYLLGIGTLLVGKVLFLDGLHMHLKTLGVPHANPDCPVCGAHPSIRSLSENRKAYMPAGCSFPRPQKTEA